MSNFERKKMLQTTWVLNTLYELGG
jgi:hypothetical protein